MLEREKAGIGSVCPEEWKSPEEAPVVGVIITSIRLPLLVKEGRGVAEGTTVEITAVGRESDGVAGVVGVLGRREAWTGTVGGVGNMFSASKSIPILILILIPIPMPVVAVGTAVEEGFVVEGVWRSGGVFSA